jgi:serpin B
MNLKSALCLLLALSILCAAPSGTAADSGTAAAATNQIGLDLYRKLSTADNNLCLSPYSIENALAMTFAGAEGQTKDEMARVLHLSKDEAVHAGFSELQRQLREMSEKSVKAVERI